MVKSFFVRATGLGLLLLGPTIVIGCPGGDDTGSGTTASTTGTSATTSTGSGSCEGGVLVDGECRAKCAPDKCVQPAEGSGETWRNTCVENGCKLVCEAHADCFTDGTQNCVAKVEDDTMAAVNVCVSNGKVSGFGNKCPFGVECDTISACPNGMPCGMSNCGGNAAACVVDAVACVGVESCAMGRCSAEGQPYNGYPCSVTAQCPDNECAPLSCLTTGEGDADAYCSKHDCQEDVDCPGGYYCGITEDKHLICNSSPPKPQGGEQPCIDPATFTQNGQTFQEGPQSALRNTCLTREACAPCETDIDCSRVEGQRCVQIGPAKNCAVDCASDTDCEPDFTCVANSCIPRFGSCKGTGQFCEPCLNDLDCAGGPGTSACISGAGNQQMCFDLTFPATCTTDNDCPTAPGGKHGECFDEGEGVSPSSSVYHRCYVPFNATDNKFGCW